MDVRMYSDAPLSAELKVEAEGVKKVILDIMNRGAKGDIDDAK